MLPFAEKTPANWLSLTQARVLSVMPSRRYLSLDGLRGVCALSILLFHCKDLFHKGSLFSHGYLAVDVFFILSGFVISLTYEDKLQKGQGSRTFLLNRARRLLPTYWLGAILNIAIVIWVITSGYAHPGDTQWMVWVLIPVMTILLIPDYFTPDGLAFPAMGSIAWSLFTEWIAYLAYAMGASRFRTTVLIVFAAVGWTAMTVAGYRTGTAWDSGGTRTTLFTTGLLRCLSGFFAGMALFRLHREPWFLKLPVISTEVLLAAWLVLAVIPTASATPGLDAIIVIICSPILICLLIRSDDGAPAYCKTLGDLSYPLYVVHPGILLLAVATPVFGLSQGPRPLNAFVVVGITLALAWMITWIVANFRGQKITPMAPAGYSPINFANLPEIGNEAMVQSGNFLTSSTDNIS